MTRAIYLDCDGTFIDLYGVDGWLNDLIDKKVRPYKIARPLVNLNYLARLLNKLQKQGYIIGIVSWLAKNSTEQYNKEVTNTKMKWLNKHLHSVHFDEIHIVEYGTPKHKVVNCPYGILFDDEENNRVNWLGTAYDVNNLLQDLKALL